MRAFNKRKMSKRNKNLNKNINRLNKLFLREIIYFTENLKNDNNKGLGLFTILSGSELLTFQFRVKENSYPDLTRMLYKLYNIGQFKKYRKLNHFNSKLKFCFSGYCKYQDNTFLIISANNTFGTRYQLSNDGKLFINTLYRKMRCFNISKSLMELGDKLIEINEYENMRRFS